MAVRASDLAHLEPQRVELLAKSGAVLAAVQAELAEAAEHLRAEPPIVARLALERLVGQELERARRAIVEVLK